MDFNKYIQEDALILVPALYIIGMILKSTPKIKDWLIPYILLVLGISGATLLLGLSVQSVIQGILVSGAAVLANQLIKQAKGK